MIFRVDVTIGVQNGNTVIDVYTVGSGPWLMSGAKPHKNKIVKSIEINKTEYAIEATIFFEDEIYWTSKVTDYYEQQSQTTLRESPDNKRD